MPKLSTQSFKTFSLPYVILQTQNSIESILILKKILKLTNFAVNIHSFFHILSHISKIIWQLWQYPQIAPNRMQSVLINSAEKFKFAMSINLCVRPFGDLVWNA